MNFAVIPYRDRADLTVPLVHELARQAECDGILLMDNGSSPSTNLSVFPTAAAAGATVLDCAGETLHSMWNRGLDEAAARAGGGPHTVVVLNNDVRIGPRLVSHLSHALASDPGIYVACPNYDGRPGDGTVRVEGLPMHTGHYDGTEGMCGFAFALRGSDGHRFPEELNWWFGDDDLRRTALSLGRGVGLVLGASCEHIGGGSNTGRFREEPLRSLVRADQEWFLRKWGDFR